MLTLQRVLQEQKMSDHSQIARGSVLGFDESTPAAALLRAAIASASSASVPATMDSSMDATRSAASALLESALTPEEKAFVAAHMEAMNPFGPAQQATTSAFPSNGQQQLEELSAIVARYQRLEHLKNALKWDALRMRSGAAPTAITRLQESLGGTSFETARGPGSSYALLAGLMGKSSPTSIPTMQSASTGSTQFYGVSSNNTFPNSSTLSTLLRGDNRVRPSLASLPLPPDSRKKGKGGTFPMKLHQMLSDLEREGAGDIASFLPHGRAFAIHKPREFVKHIMPKYFRMSRFSSFQRQLNLYDFHRITEGVDRGAYYHAQFIYGQSELTAAMKRNKIKGVKKAKEEHEELITEESESITGDKQVTK